MPNWCYNSMDINGDEEAKDELYRQLTYPVYDDENEGIVVLCGYPETKDKGITMREYHNLVKLAGDTDEKPGAKIYLENVYPCLNSDVPYNDRLTEWGTDREAFSEYYTINKDTYIFDTAWSPAEYAVNKIAEQYPELDIEYKYDEPGMCFCGKNDYADGKCYSSLDQSDYDNNYEKAYIDLFDLDEYGICRDCGYINGDMNDECCICESTNIERVVVGSDEDTLFKNRY